MFLWSLFVQYKIKSESVGVEQVSVQNSHYRCLDGWLDSIYWVEWIENYQQSAMSAIPRGDSYVGNLNETYQVQVHSSTGDWIHDKYDRYFEKHETYRYEY